MSVSLLIIAVSAEGKTQKKPPTFYRCQSETNREPGTALAVVQGS